MAAFAAVAGQCGLPGTHSAQMGPMQTSVRPSRWVTGRTDQDGFSVLGLGVASCAARLAGPILALLGGLGVVWPR